MATNPGHTALLDQLQNQVNLVVSFCVSAVSKLETDLVQLDCTGKLFAAAHANPKSPPVAQASQLRHVLPSATNRFHEALDQLEEEIVSSSNVYAFTGFLAKSNAPATRQGCHAS